MATYTSTTLDVNTLTSLEEIQKAYNQLASEEEAVNEELDALLARQCHLEAKLRNITKMLPNLQLVHSDASQLADMIKFTSTLAENVSAKVRQLDLAKSRVSECQQRVHDLLDLQLCCDGVQTAMQNEDFEQAAGHVHRFLTMDETLLKLTARDVSEDGSVDSSFSVLHQAESQLKIVVTHKFDEAVRDEDVASVERFFKIFPLLSMHEEGLKKFSLYLCAKVQDTAQKNLKQACESIEGHKRSNVIFADTLTMLFEGIARFVEIHQPLVETYYGPGRMLTVISHFQKECDRQVTKILTEFRKARDFPRKVQMVMDHMRSSHKTVDKLDPRELDLLLGELTILNARTELYNRFMKRRISNDIEVSTTEEETRLCKLNEMEELSKNSGLCRQMQELLGDYIMLEQYFMTESVKKAVTMDVIDEGSLTTSMVDDVFFIVKKCIRRSLSSSSVDGVCAVINNACTLLESDFCNVLQAQLKQGFPSGYLDLTQAYNVIQSSLQQGKLQASDTEKAKAVFLMYLNNADASTEYIQTLQKTLEGEISSLLVNTSVQDKAKLESCLSGLSTVSSRLKSIVDYGMQQLRSSAIKPRVKPWVDVFTSVNHNVTEEEFSNYEANDPFIQTFIMHLNGLLSSFKESLTLNNYDSLVSILTAEVTVQLEKVVMKSTFNRFGGLQFDKELRALVSYLTNVTTWTIRDKFARLTQIATILNLERVSEIMDYWGSNSGPLTWRLTPTEVCQILALRVDFRSEDVKRLKL